MSSKEAQIQKQIDIESDAWEQRDAATLCSLFHPDMIWPYPQTPQDHDPATWVFPFGKFNRTKWTAYWRRLFAEFDLIHNRRETVKITLSDEGDAAFAVVDVDTLWRHKKQGVDFHWLGRNGKGYVLVAGEWKINFHTGLLLYPQSS